MSRIAERERDRMYVELHVRELQRMVHRDAGTKMIVKEQADLISDVAAGLEVASAINRVQTVLARGVDRHIMHGTGMPEALADALTRILDLGERMGVDLGVAVGARISGGSLDTGRRSP